jgi:hypothetical protein
VCSSREQNHDVVARSQTLAHISSSSPLFPPKPSKSVRGWCLARPLTGGAAPSCVGSAAGDANPRVSAPPSIGCVAVP